MSAERIQKILQHTNTKPKTISKASSLDPTDFNNNCENIIGFNQVPIGVCGPLNIAGTQANGDYILPLATTEACLVASCNRGAKFSRNNGSIKTTAKKIGISRAPVYRMLDAQPLEHYQNWLTENHDQLQACINQQSSHTKLLRAECLIQEQYLYINFWYDTADAMGMNMATIATKAISTKILEPELNLQLIATSSNLCSDKKASKQHIEKGRGYWTTAEIRFTDAELEQLNCNRNTLKAVYDSKIIRGSQLAGSLTQNAHHANLVAALWLATGQDLAHVVEGSLGKTIIEFSKSEILIKVICPSLVCGTVGGGTKLPTQQEALQIMNLRNKSSNGAQAMEFAEVATAGILCAEVSLLGAIAAQQLADSHNRFR